MEIQPPDAPRIEVLKDPTQTSEAIRPAFEYWRAQRADAWAPSSRDFRLETLPPALIPWCVVVDVVTGPATAEAGAVDFVYRFWGTERTRLFGRDLTGRSISELQPVEMRDANYIEYDEVRNTRQAIVCRKPARLSNLRAVQFESLRLPITRNGETVDRIFAATCYQHLTEDHYRLFGTEAPAIHL